MKRKIKNILKNGGGFTLLEALVATFIIGVISSVLVVNWRRNEDQYKLQRAAQGVVQSIRKVQEMALTGKKYSPTAAVPTGYGITFETISPNSYMTCADTYPAVAPDKKCTGSDDAAVEIISMESSVRIYKLYKIKASETEEDTGINVVFSVPDGFVSVDPVRADVVAVQITIKKTSAATCPSKDCRDIIVRKTGEISIH